MDNGRESLQFKISDMSHRCQSERGYLDYTPPSFSWLMVYSEASKAFCFIRVDNDLYISMEQPLHRASEIPAFFRFTDHEYVEATHWFKKTFKDITDDEGRVDIIDFAKFLTVHQIWDRT